MGDFLEGALEGSEERSRAMIIIGCDFHTRFQKIAMVDTEIGEITKRRLEHGNGEARAFCAALPRPARVGMEATICSRVSVSSSASSENRFRMRIAPGHPGSEEMSYFAVCRVIRFW
jgi:hypothetical protein